jgi:hypothetical protein
MRAAYEVTNDRKNWEVIMGEYRHTSDMYKKKMREWFGHWPKIRMQNSKGAS